MLVAVDAVSTLLDSFECTILQKGLYICSRLLHSIYRYFFEIHPLNQLFLAIIYRNCPFINDWHFIKLYADRTQYYLFHLCFLIAQYLVICVILVLSYIFFSYILIVALVMFSTPGVIKFFWPKDNVQTKYTRLYDIPLIDINKQLITLDPARHHNFLLLHIADLSASLPLVKQIQQLAKEENTKEDFAGIRKVYPSALGKMVVNGQDAHPFAKFLRRICLQTYDYDMSGARKTIPIGAFRKEGEKITYYSQERMQELIAQLQKSQ